MGSLSNLKVCFLAGTLEHGGAERQLYYILQALRQAGALPRLLSLDSGEVWEERIKALGVTVDCVGKKASRIQRLFCVLREIRKHPPSVLQSQHFYANAYVGLAAKFCRLGGIGAMRNTGDREVSGSGHLGGWLNLHCPGIIAANSKIAIQYASDHGVSQSRLYYLPNVVDTTQFQPANDPFKKPVRLIAVGRLVKQKRLDRFISILSRLRTIHRLDVRGTIIGPGCQNENLLPELKSQARQLGLSHEALEFRGGVPDARRFYGEAAICVLTSDYEGTPNVLLEAMASGLPVVASKVGGVPDIVQHGHTGFLLEPDDVEGFTTALASLVKNLELRAQMGRQARTFVEEHHSLNRLPGYLNELYRLALPGRLPETSAHQEAPEQIKSVGQNIFLTTDGSNP